ncbi:coiled-coil and C2 domain-containing protein 1-like isoform X1 [Schistocerca nitens]|uniref:coiled-coil and C2 domain-containing protein 1-like isoform X1 n=1 Tax=Schistocerca nitens TaxID=7011 RepID=UPI0021181B9D|nr:coiled-coil and C2 domain-containing protein 1-like isoform X1 [Schistocerca nitens]
MFGRKKEARTKPRTAGGLSQFGLLDLPDINAVDSNEMGTDDDEDDDSALEAELLAITSGNLPARPKKARPAPAVPQVNLDAMVAESLKDIPSDEDVSGDDDDPELLHELGTLAEEDTVMEAEKPPSTPVALPKRNEGNPLVTTLEERLKMYQEAEKNAKSAGESSRARRFGRGIKTLNDMLKQAKAGRVVNEEDIPPPVAVTLTKKPDVPSVADTPTPEMVPTRPAPQPPVPERPPQFGVPLPGMASPVQDQSPGKEVPSPMPSSPTSTADQNNTIAALAARRDEYKMAALQAKKAGDRETAINYVRIVKKFEIVISAVEGGQAVDLSEMPPPPPPIGSVKTTPGVAETAVEESEKQRDADNSQSTTGGAAEGEEQPETDLYSAPPTPTTVMEALIQRLDKYKSVEKAAKEEGNASKARRIGRIVKQYENAIKLHKAGKPIPVDELPTPPGFAPIPQEGGSSASAAGPSSPPSQPPVDEETPKPAPRPQPSPAPTPRAQPPTPHDVQPESEKANVRKSPQSRQEKQLALLLARQKEFKEAALQAKRKGEINQAKEYLRLAKGFDPLIEATNCGLPVDMDSVPVPPATKIVLESDFDIVNADDCIPGSDLDIFDKLEEDLLKQAKMCLTTRDHFKAIGDIASANRFEQLAVHSKKDLDAVRYAHKRNESIPKFHYENKTFSIVQCCTDLGDNDLELTIVQGINYNVTNPKDVDTYVRFEFPYPNEYPQKDKTAVVKDTNNPQYNQTFPLTIQRNVRACQRIFKRHSLKCEVWSRGSVIRNLCCFCCPETCGKTISCSGFFRGDSLIGTANIKLQPLETKCILHDAYDLLEGRKTVGGKLEVKIRIRNPIVTKQVEQVQEKWLVIDSM